MSLKIDQVISDKEVSENSLERLIGKQKLTLTK